MYKPNKFTMMHSLVQGLKYQSGPVFQSKLGPIHTGSYQTELDGTEQTQKKKKRRRSGSLHATSSFVAALADKEESGSFI